MRRAADTPERESLHHSREYHVSPESRELLRHFAGGVEWPALAQGFHLRYGHGEHPMAKRSAIRCPQRLVSFGPGAMGDSSSSGGPGSGNTDGVELPGKRFPAL